MGYIGYKVFEREAFDRIENELASKANDWRRITESYVEQQDRVHRREESMMYQKLSAVVSSVREMYLASYDHHGGEISGHVMESLFERTKGVDISRNGKVIIIDKDGKCLLACNSSMTGKYILDIEGQDGDRFMKRIFDSTRKLIGKQTYTTSYTIDDGNEPLEWMSASAHIKELDWVLVVSIPYRDFWSFELQGLLQDEVADKMADMRIGEQGYLWVVDSSGNYVVSKDKLRDGENILGFTDERGAYFVPEIISGAKSKGEGEAYIRYYPWKNIGEDRAYPMVSAAAYVPGWDWVIGASAYQMDFLKGLEEIRNYLIVVCMAAAIACSGIAYYFSLFIIRPIEEIGEYSVSASKGGKSDGINPKTLRKDDEIGNLARSVRDVLENLKVKIHDLRESRAELEDSNREMEIAHKELKIKNRELEKMNKYMIGRELRMIELKNRIRECEKGGANKDGSRTFEEEK